MIKVMLKSKYIRVFALIILVISVISCITANSLVSTLENVIANIPEKDLDDTGSGKYMTYKMEHPSGYTAEGKDSGWRIVAENGDLIYETANKIELPKRAGYVYETDKNGTKSIVNLESGQVEWTLAENENFAIDDAGFWVIEVEVPDGQNYFYLLDENYQYGADGVIFNAINNDKSLKNIENYIYGRREVNYTMNNKDGIETGERLSDSCVIDSNGEVVYSTTEGYVWYITEDKARIEFNHSEKDDVYVSLVGKRKGQIVEVIKDE